MVQQVVLNKIYCVIAYIVTNQKHRTGATQAQIWITRNIVTFVQGPDHTIYIQWSDR